MNRRYLLLLAALAIPIVSAPSRDPLPEGFRNPPPAARMRCYWWWLNGNTTKETITRDLEEMKSKGYGGALLVDADGSGQEGNREAPAGPMFGSPAWRELYLHALSEADRLDLEISLNILSGWNLGGPSVKPEQAAKLLTWSRITVEGPAEVSRDLPQPPDRLGFYRDIAVAAYPLRHGPGLPGSSSAERRPIRQLLAKESGIELGMSMPKTTFLLEDYPAAPGEEDTMAADVRDVSDRMSADGHFSWAAPAGTWEVLRIGYTASGARVSTSSETWQGLAIDCLDRPAFEEYWRQALAPLLDEARPYLGRSLKYLVTDSWELGGFNWTAAFREKFRAARGYDLLPYLPVLAGRIVGSRQSSGRFLNDFRRTIADLVIQQHYQPFVEMAARYGLGIHPESGGPHGAPIDALETLGVSAFPQTEYWAPSATHRTRDEDRFFVKEASSAAHIYGKTIAAAEGMTSIGPQWEETPGSLQPAFDQAITEGMNRLVWHTFTSSPKEMGLPGQEYFAGTHLNPNNTWWRQAGAFIAYLNRVQFAMQQGLPVSDVLYYYGDEAPNFVQLKASDPARVLPGYDYDVTDEEVLTKRLSVQAGDLVLPEGVRYRLLVLPDLPSISPAAILAVLKLVEDGATVVGRKPEHATGLRGDDEVRATAAEVWGNCEQNGLTQHRFGKGTVYCGAATRDVLAAMHVAPDFEGAGLDYAHRQSGGEHIYFIRNTRAEPVTEDVILRAEPGLAPELWHAESGSMEPVAVYEAAPDQRTRVPLHLEARDSAIVVFRRPAGLHALKVSGPAGRLRVSPDGAVEVETAAAGRFTASLSNGATLTADAPAPIAAAISGPWNLEFTPGWGAPAGISLPRLQSWTENADPGIRYYSGTAKYSTRFQLPAKIDGSQTFELDLGDVREVAHVWVNGRDLGVLWKRPFRVELGAAAHAGWNDLVVEVTNLWPNRLIGDQLLAPEKRLTRTNITKFTADSPLRASGLLGPVAIEARQAVRLAVRP